MSMLKQLSLVVCGFVFSGSLLAGQENSALARVSTKKASQQELLNAKRKNQQYLQKKADGFLQYIENNRAFIPMQPVKDDAAFKYLLMSADTSFDTENFKSTISRNLPEEMTLVLMAREGDEQRVINRYKQWIPESRIKVLSMPSSVSGRVFWARDWTPFPVYKNGMKEVGLVSSLYDQHSSYRSTMDRVKTKLAGSVHAQINHEDFYFVGGNLLADEEGTCFTLKSDRLYNLTKEVLQSSYGCKDVIILPHVSGIGDVDEVIKILPNKVVLTNIPGYQKTIEEHGYNVTMLPGVDKNVSSNGFTNLGTYANSVILGNKVFMPSYGRDSDDRAKKVYEDFGYTVYKADSKSISFQGMGSFHCATMGYPNIDLEVFAQMMGGQIFKETKAGWNSPTDIFNQVLTFLM